MSQPLTRVVIVVSVHNQLGLPKKECSEMVETLLEIIKSTLASGEDILISGFGKFNVKDKKERRGRKTLRTMLADTPLVKNLQNDEYMKILLNDKSSLEE